MFELNEIEPSRLKRVEAPFSMDVMREFFMDKSKVFIVDYEKSQLKGKSLLIYLSNLDIPCEIEFSKSVPVEEKFEMVKAYIESRNMFSIPSFTKTFAEVLFAFRDLGYEAPYESPILNERELSKFVQQNEELIWRHVNFCNSLPYYAVTTSVAYREEFGEKPEEGIPTIDDPFYVGQNTVDLFVLDGFFEMYFIEPPETDPVYFLRQYRELMFRGQNLYKYFAVENNSLLAMMTAMAEGLETPEDFEKYHKKMEEKAEGNAPTV